jgi:hypothetical protein
MIRTAIIDDVCRWELRRIWNDVPEPRLLVWLMLNPSTADAEKDDPTLLRIIKWGKAWGYDGVIVVNLYPFRSPSPLDLAAWHKAGGLTVEVFQRNMEITLAAMAECDWMVMAGWGGSLPKPEGVLPYIRMLNTIGLTKHGAWPVWRCLGVSQGGMPIHPMARGKNRIPDDATPMVYDFVKHLDPSYKEHANAV